MSLGQVAGLLSIDPSANDPASSRIQCRMIGPNIVEPPIDESSDDLSHRNAVLPTQRPHAAGLFRCELDLCANHD